MEIIRNIGLALPIHPAIQTLALPFTDTEAEVATSRGDQAVQGGEVLLAY